MPAAAASLGVSTYRSLDLLLYVTPRPSVSMRDNAMSVNTRKAAEELQEMSASQRGGELLGCYILYSMVATT
jgi:hypothetical protein